MKKGERGKIGEKLDEVIKLFRGEINRCKINEEKKKAMGGKKWNKKKNEKGVS